MVWRDRMRSMVDEQRVHPMGNGGDKVAVRHTSGYVLLLLDEGESRRPIKSDQEAVPALPGLHARQIDIDDETRTGFGLLFDGDFAVNARQSSHAVALDTPVQRGSRQIRDRLLQCTQISIMRQSDEPSDDNINGFLVDRDDRRFPFATIVCLKR